MSKELEYQEHTKNKNRRGEYATAGKWCDTCGQGFAQTAMDSVIDNHQKSACAITQAYKALLVREFPSRQEKNITFQQVLKIARTLRSPTSPKSLEEIVKEVLSTAQTILNCTVDERPPEEIAEDILSENITVPETE